MRARDGVDGKIFRLARERGGYHLTSHEVRRRATTVAGPGKKRLELLLDNLVNDSSVCPVGSQRSSGGRSDHESLGGLQIDLYWFIAGPRYHTYRRISEGRQKDGD